MTCFRLCYCRFHQKDLFALLMFVGTKTKVLLQGMGWGRGKWLYSQATSLHQALEFVIHCLLFAMAKESPLTGNGFASDNTPV